MVSPDKYADEISGDQDWAQVGFEIYGTGNHTLKWEYSKDGSDPDPYPGSDCAWLDCLTWTP